MENENKQTKIWSIQPPPSWGDTTTEFSLSSIIQYHFTRTLKNKNYFISWLNRYICTIHRNWWKQNWNGTTMTKIITFREFIYNIAWYSYVYRVPSSFFLMFSHKFSLQYKLTVPLQIPKYINLIQWNIFLMSEHWFNLIRW